MIYAIVPLIIGMLVLLKPQLFTKADLSDEKNGKIKKQLFKAGWLALIGGSIALVVVILDIIKK